MRTDKAVNRFFGFMLFVWVMGAALSLTLTGFIIWALYRFVIHFTA